MPHPYNDKGSNQQQKHTDSLTEPTFIMFPSILIFIDQLAMRWDVLFLHFTTLFVNFLNVVFIGVRVLFIILGV